jgi:hypothetical protein
VGDGTDGQKVADAAVQVWRRVAAVLSPIIGQRGFAALYQRSVYLQRGRDPWLAPAHEGVALSDDFPALRAALSQQPPERAAEAQSALLQTFQNLLVTLIGEALTERLLQPVWDTPSSSGPPAQDTTP